MLLLQKTSATTRSRRENEKEVGGGLGIWGLKRKRGRGLNEKEKAGEGPNKEEEEEAAIFSSPFFRGNGGISDLVMAGHKNDRRPSTFWASKCSLPRLSFMP